MELWCEDFAAGSLDRLLSLQVENRAWGKELRRQSQILVESRLAKKISQNEYVHGRTQSQEEVAECRRRAAVLVSQISRASREPLSVE